MIALSSIEGDALIVACAISAGIHAALTPTHFAEGAGAGLGFLGATVVLAALVAVLRRRASHLLWRGRPAVAVTHLQPKGRL